MKWFEGSVRGILVGKAQRLACEALTSLHLQSERLTLMPSSLFPFYSVQDASPRDGATHIQGGSYLVKPFWKYSCQCTQRYISVHLSRAIPNPGKLILINQQSDLS